jgi:hypothetical protein
MSVQLVAKPEPEKVIFHRFAETRIDAEPVAGLFVPIDHAAQLFLVVVVGRATDERCVAFAVREDFSPLGIGLGAVIGRVLPCVDVRPAFGVSAGPEVVNIAVGGGKFGYALDGHGCTSAAMESSGVGR